MMNPRCFFPTVLILLVFLASCAADPPVEEIPASFCGDRLEAVEARIDDLLPRMSLADKVAQMHGEILPDVPLHPTPDNQRLGIPGFRMIDGPRGVNSGNATAFPVGMARGATWDPGLEELVGEAIGEEARAKGASVLLAPTINLLRHPRWGRAQETYGEDPFHVGTMGSGFVRGAQRKVIADAKHFALNSIENTRFSVDVSVDARTLHEIYLPHFKMLVQDAQVASVMSAYNLVNGHYCAENRQLLKEILKGSWGFKGFVVSDWVFGTRSTVPSANAGLDIEMPQAMYYGESLVDAVEAGQVSESVIDEAVRRILRTKFCFRLDEDPPIEDPARVESQAHLDLALEVARKAIVLLKNENAVLPLDRGSLSSIVVVGALADRANLGDTGSSEVRPSFAVTPLAGIQDGAGALEVIHVPGDVLEPDDHAAIQAADAAVIIVGLTSEDEGESLISAGDRKTMGLSADHEQLVSAVAALHPRTIVVLEGGSAITMAPWLDEVEAVMMAWYPGQLGGHAIADVLFGDVNPTGRLPISFPRSEADLPAFVNDQDEVTYDYHHGYRHLDREGIQPLFEFGFGLSYTTFEYRSLTIGDPDENVIPVSVEVSNTGNVAGDEIVQVYASYEGSRVDRPERELKGFSRVHLEPAETRTVVVDVRKQDLGFYDVDAQAFEVESIPHRFHAGSSSRRLPLHESIVFP